MFKITANPTFTSPVKISRPGESTPGVINITFKHKSVQALQDWKIAFHDKSISDALITIIENMDGLSDDQGSCVAYTEATLLLLLQQFHSAGEQILSAYFSELQGNRLKN